jgi:hypothetical protein
MITDVVDIEKTESIFFKKNLEKFPYLANENPDDLPSCFFEEELLSLEEFDEYLKESMYERFGIKLDLSPENLASFE